MSRPAGFIIDVPVTLSVAVRGEGITIKEAQSIASRFAEMLSPSDEYCSGYTDTAVAKGVFRATVMVTEATLEASREETCEVLEELEEEPDESPVEAAHEGAELGTSD